MQWAGESVICPDIAEGESLQLKGDPSNEKQTYIQFLIRKCDPFERLKNNKSPCMKEAIIDEWIRDVEVTSWTID